MTAKFKVTLAIIALASACFVTAGAASPLPVPDDKKPSEKTAAAPLEGGYTIVSGEKDGKAIPPERLKGCVVLFTAEKVVGTDKDKKELFAASYVLDTTHTPWIIKMKSTTPKEEEAIGLIKKEGDSITLIYSLPGAPAPVEFRTRDKQHLFVLKSLVKSDAPKQ